jgi:hypothetical protein
MRRFWAFLIALVMVLGPFPAQWVFAQTADSTASADEVQEIQHLAQAGYLDAKTIDLTAKTMSEDQVADALAAIQDHLKSIDLKSLQSGNTPYQTADLEALLQMVDDYSDLLHDRKISTWLYENRVKKMIQALAPAADAVTPMPSPSPTAPVPTAAVAPTATALPGPTLGDINALQDKLKDLDQRFADLQVKYDQRLQDEDSNDQLLKSKDQERQDEMKLVKNLMDTYESNLQKVNERLDQVSDKANQKTMTDEELEQELTILHKDLRDNTQDLTILKQQVSQLDAPQKVQQDPLDDFLTSKWLAGGALLVGLAALTVGLTKK